MEKHFKPINRKSNINLTGQGEPKEPKGKNKERVLMIV